MALVQSASMAHAMVVPAGEVVDLSNPDMNMDCGDLEVHGTLNLAGGTMTGVRQVLIGAGGQLNINGGTVLGVSGGWSNQGSFSAGDGQVAITDQCGTTTTIAGNSSFNQLSATAAGQTLQFTAGSTQTVTGALTLNGQTVLGLGGSAALTLVPTATQLIEDVGVDGVDASGGQRLAPTQTNQIAGGIAPNWFAAPAPSGELMPVPVNAPLGLLGIGLALLAAARRRARANNS